MKGADPRIAVPDGHAFQESSDNVFLPPAKQEQQDPDPDPQPQPTGPRTGAYSDSTANYTINADGTATYKGPKKDQATVTIPATIKVDGFDVPVTKIADKAFKAGRS